MRESHLILSNAAIMWAARILLLVPQLILVPFLIRTVGDAGYGVYALILSLLMSIDQLERSLQSGVVKYSAAFWARNEIEEINKVVSSSSVYSLILAVVASTGIFIACVFYRGATDAMAFSLVVVGITVLFVIPLTPYIAVIQSQQRYYVNAIADTSSKYIGLAAVVGWFYAVGPSVEAAVVIASVLLFLSRLAQVPVAYRFVPGLHNRARFFEYRSFYLIAAFGAAIVLGSLCIVANTTGVRWLMGTLVTTSFVAHLAIMLMPSQLLSQIVEAATVAVMPATSAYDATGNRRMLHELLIRGMRYTTLLVLAGLITATFLMRNVLAVWIGPDYVFLAPYAVVLFASTSFMLSTSIAHHMLKGLGKLRAIVLIYVTGLVIVPISSMLVIYRITHNPYFAVTSGLAAGHLLSGLLQLGFCVKTIHADVREVLVRAYVQPVLVGTAVFVFVVGTLFYVRIEGLPGRLLVSVLSVSILFLGSYLLIATAAERRQVHELIRFSLGKIPLVRTVDPREGTE